jgi:(2S)-methylsuccinyl-CoA dehydrogenase
MSVARPDLLAALVTGQQVLRSGIDRLRADVEGQQVLAYDVAHVASALAAAAVCVDDPSTDPRLATAVVADTLADLAQRLFGRESLWGVAPGVLDSAHAVVAAGRDPALLASLADQPLPRRLPEDFVLVADTFGRFARDHIAPHAQHVHRTNGDVPEEIITGLGALGAFGLSCPTEYGGYSEGGPNEFLAMVVATEELSRASLGIGGSLITRPEILTRALLRGGTEAQKLQWLPKLASGELMGAVAVSEPDFGSDVASITTTAIPTLSADGRPGFVINGVKTWCTFAGRADVLMLLARTNPDRSQTHRGLSLFTVSKPRAPGHAFAFTQPDAAGTADAAGKMTGRAIDTLGYRGMHSFEVALENWWVSADALVGGDAGVGRGFYLQMEGFENGRIQTAARAVGLMQAAFDHAHRYAAERTVFGRPVGDYELTKVKLGRMAATIAAARGFTYHVAALMGRGEGATEASMVKALSCRAAEWVTREAMQIHGGYGYAEEYTVSRLFVDARVLSIFEGADETLCLRVIARRLAQA